MRASQDPNARLVREISTLHAQWCAAGAVGSFSSCLVARHNATHRALQRTLDVLTALPSATRRDWRRLRRRRIGEGTIAALMPELAARFMRERSRGVTAAFDDWYAAIVREHPTAKGLRTFLGQGLDARRGAR